MSLSLVSLHLLESWRRWQRLFLCVSGGGGQQSAASLQQNKSNKRCLKMFLFSFFQGELLPCQISQQMRASETLFVVWGAFCVERGESGPHKEESQEDVVLEMAGWTTLNVRFFFWTEMPAQVAAVEAATSPPPSTPPPPPSSQWGNCFNETRRALTERD